MKSASSERGHRPAASTAAVALWSLLVTACAGPQPVRTVLPLAAPPAKARQTPAPALAHSLQQLSERLSPAGVTVGAPMVVGFLASGARQSYPVELAGGSCVTLLSLATDGIVDMDAALYTPEGRLLAADAQPDSHPSLQVCVGDATRRFYVVLQSYEGSGSVVVVPLLGRRSSFEQVAKVVGGRPARALSADPNTPVEDRMQAFSSGLGRRGYETRGQPTDLALASQQRVRFPVPVRTGQCYAVAAFAHAGLRDIQLRVFDDRGQAVAGDSGPLSGAHVHFCSATEAEYGAEAHARDGAGTATLVVLEGPAHRVLSQAGRWIGKSEAGQLRPRATLEATLAKLRAQADGDGYRRALARTRGYLQPREAVAHEVLLRAQRCYLVAAATGEGVSSVSLGVAGPAAAGASVERDPTAHGTRLRVCPSVTGIAQIRLAVTAGTGPYELLVLQR